MFFRENTLLFHPMNTEGKTTNIQVRKPSDLAVFFHNIFIKNKIVGVIGLIILVISSISLTLATHLAQGLPDVTYIDNADDLNLIRKNPNGYFQLSTSYLELPDNWSPIGTKENPFTGTIDGDGCTIASSGSKFLFEESGSGEYYSGFVGYNNGIIKNLYFWESGCNFDNTDFAKTNNSIIYGTVAAYNFGEISNIWIESAGGKVTADLLNSQFIYGIVAGYSSGRIEYCRAIRSLGPFKLPGKSQLNIGLVGQAKDASFNACEADYQIETNSRYNALSANLGGICGISENSTFSNCLSSFLFKDDGDAAVESIGGICGSSVQSSFSYCVSTASSFSSEIHSGGGVVGSAKNNSSFSNCIVIKPPADQPTVGQIVGQNSSNSIFGNGLFYCANMTLCDTNGSKFVELQSIDLSNLGWNMAIWKQEGTVFSLARK